ncbi:MAG: fibrobacter succinogenes major paralogous domain-containing protein [Bacteroidota bacterium]
MKKISILLLIILMGFLSIRAQIAINTDGSVADNSAMLDIKSTTKGVLLPRMTNIQIQTIVSPADGLLVYSTDDSQIYCFNLGDNEWKEINYGTGTLQLIFICGISSVIDSEGNYYNTVLIGTQCWIAENLNIGTRIDASNNQTNNGVIEKYCYNNDPANCTTYGGLYQWNEMMQYVTTEGTQGICPDGWHLPTDEEWKTMEMQLGMSQSQADDTDWRGTDEGGKMKETGTTHWNTPNTGATNTSGFTALPGGNCYSPSGTFYKFGQYGFWWSSTEFSGTAAWHRVLGYNYPYVYRYGSGHSYGYNVRCIKN